MLFFTVVLSFDAYVFIADKRCIDQQVLYKYNIICFVFLTIGTCSQIVSRCMRCAFWLFAQEIDVFSSCSSSWWNSMTKFDDETEGGEDVVVLVWRMWMMTVPFGGWLWSGGWSRRMVVASGMMVVSWEDGDVPRNCVVVTLSVCQYRLSSTSYRADSVSVPLLPITLLPKPLFRDR